MLLQGSATLSMAYAAALFGDAVLRGLNGATATECAYVESDVTDVPFFATKVKLGTEGECVLQCAVCMPLAPGFVGPNSV